MSADQEGRIKQLARKDAEEMLRVINKAARRYEGEIQDDRYSEPYMPRSELEERGGTSVNALFLNISEYRHE